MTKLTIIEVNYGFWRILQTDRKKRITGQSEINVPHDVLRNPQKVAQLADKINIRGRFLILLNTGAAVVRIGVGKDETESNFGDKYVYDEEFINGTRWTSALPRDISDGLVEICSIMGIPSSRILTIDTLEYRMAEYFANAYKNESAMWLILQQDPGIRIIIMKNSAPSDCHYISNDPAYRMKELTGLWYNQKDLPEAVCLSCENCGWIRDFLLDKHVRIIPDAKYDVIESWLKKQ